MKSHGHCKNHTTSSTYATWADMLQRCKTPTHHAYARYGGRGIKVCLRWRMFENFLEDMGERPWEGAQLDRINNDGNYEKDNCHWATAAENNANKRLYSTAVNNRSGMTGVSYRKGCWRTYAGRVCLYQGKDLFEACCVRKSWEAAKKGLNT